MASTAEEKEAIREVLAVYCYRLDEGRFGEFAELFTEDGTWDTAFGKATGRGPIAELARNIRAHGGDPPPPAVHLLSNIVIRVEGDRAEVRSHWAMIENGPEGPRIGSAGGYADVMAKPGREWLFRYRKIDRFIAP
jgi:3-phenylpropionate/cinnamic acid dioxygenase small subunit